MTVHDDPTPPAADESPETTSSLWRYLVAPVVLLVAGGAVVAAINATKSLEGQRQVNFERNWRLDKSRVAQLESGDSDVTITADEGRRVTVKLADPLVPGGCTVPAYRTQSLKAWIGTPKTSPASPDPARIGHARIQPARCTVDLPDGPTRTLVLHGHVGLAQSPFLLDTLSGELTGWFLAPSAGDDASEPERTGSFTLSFESR